MSLCHVICSVFHHKDSIIDINVRDWLHLQEDGVILNHSKMKKLGFEVGELVITIIKDFPPHKTN